MEQIEFRELVELFLVSTIHDIKSQGEVPNINFKFDKDGFILFEDIIKNPFLLEGYWTPNAAKEDLELLNTDDAEITITIHDSNRFFELLKEIINSLIKLRKFYGISSSSRNTAMNVMKRIWLRMGINDIQNIESFLEKQLEFVNDRTFDIKFYKKISTYEKYDVLMTTNTNETWDESTRCMNFIMKDNSSLYELPRVLYDIDNNGTCYIYAIQTSDTNNRNKKVQRDLYKLNKGIENTNVHPSKVYSLLLFIEELKKKGISKIVVPGLQVLSYDYHILLSEKASEDLEEAKKKLEDNPDDFYIQKEYKYYQEWYDKVHNKEDKISYLKTEELYNLIYRITLHDSSIEILNDVSVQDDSMYVKIK